MSSAELEQRRMREAFASLAAVAGDGGGCPEPDRLWASTRSELPGSRNEEVILHLGECASCATAWRLGRELGLSDAQQSLSAGPLGHRQPGLLWRWVPLAAALLAAVGVALIVRPPARSGRAPVYRSPEGRWLESLLPAGSALPREAFVLRWTAGPEGSLYDVHVSAESLKPLARASGLRQAEYRVEQEKLADVASGGRILWRVTAHGPDGRELSSRTFVTVVQ